MVTAAHYRQVTIRQHRLIDFFKRRAATAERDATFYAHEYEDVLRLCARAGFNPYQYENLEGARAQFGPAGTAPAED